MCLLIGPYWRKYQNVNNAITDIAGMNNLDDNFSFLLFDIKWRKKRDGFNYLWNNIRRIPYSLDSSVDLQIACKIWYNITHLVITSGPFILIKLASDVVATAFAIIVLPVPEGPQSNIPFGSWIPASAKSSLSFIGHSIAWEEWLNTQGHAAWAFYAHELNPSL